MFTYIKIKLNLNVYGENHIDLDCYDVIKDGTNSVLNGVMHRQFRGRSALNATFHQNNYIFYLLTILKTFKVK